MAMVVSEEEKILVEIDRRRREESHLHDNFRKHYQERDFVKASEFLWGSISKIAYAIGLPYGKKLGKHKEIVLLMRELAESRNKPEVIDWINAAESLHSNFYHNWMEEETFEDYVRKVIKLRYWLIKILDEEAEKVLQSVVK